MTLEEFGNTELAITHYVDICNCFIENIFNPNHVLDYFTCFSNLTCFELCKKAMDLVKDDRPFWTHVSAVVLPLKPTTLDEWISYMENPLQACDELFLFMLN